MEAVIPPRDHGPSTYRYTWDENGEVTQVIRVQPPRPFSTTSHFARYNPQWPFQSTNTNADPDAPSPTSPYQTRRNTTTTTHSTYIPYRPYRPYRPTRNASNASGSSSTYSQDHDYQGDTTTTTTRIPSYIASYLRRTSTSTTANNNNNNNNTPQEQQQQLYPAGARTATPQHRGVEIVQQHPAASDPRHRSRVADFGYDEEEGGAPGSVSVSPVSGDVDRNSSRGGRGSAEGEGEEEELAALRRVESHDAGSQAQEQEQEVGEEEEQRGFLDVDLMDVDMRMDVDLERDGEKEKSGVVVVEVVGGGEAGWVGWRAGVGVVVLVMFLVLITGFVCLIVAISGVSLEAGRSAVFVGGCAAAKGVDWALHAVISVFVVVMVAGANYAFQVLSSPTREEVAAAHKRGEWLDIGVPSLRNLGRVENSRRVLGVVVLGAAILTQIMYNAVISVSRTAPNFKAAVVSESFTRGALFSNDLPHNSGGLSRPELLALQQRASRGELVRLATPMCLTQFGGAFETEYSAVLLVSKQDTPSLIQTSEGVNSDVLAFLVPEPSSIQYCLAQPAPASTCEVNLNASLLGCVALLNSIALVATAAILFKRPSSFHPLATLGDAISSFLEEPDPTTQGACLLSKTDVWQGRWPLTEAKYWVPKNHYWLRSVSFSHWITAFCIWSVSIGLAAAGLAFSIAYEPTSQLSPFGTASPRALLPLPATTPPFAAAAVAGLPQLLLALLYFTVNALLTTYHLSHESSLFALAPARPLRVSASPVGAQTTSLYLTLPARASALLITLFAAMSFLLSQSFFPVTVRLVDAPPLSPNNALPPAITSPAGPGSTTQGGTSTVTALGLSGTALLALLSALVLLAAAVVILGLRRAPPAGLVNGEMRGNPMAVEGGSCSAVVSARCHPLARERGLWAREVMWGVVRDGVGLGVSHCGFTAGRGGVVMVGRNYA